MSLMEWKLVDDLGTFASIFGTEYNHFAQNQALLQVSSWLAKTFFFPKINLRTEQRIPLKCFGINLIISDEDMQA